MRKLFSTKIIFNEYLNLLQRKRRIAAAPNMYSKGALPKSIIPIIINIPAKT
jgi:hypothetical protein